MLFRGLLCFLPVLLLLITAASSLEQPLRQESGGQLAGAGNCQVKNANTGKITVSQVASQVACCANPLALAFVQGSSEKYCLGTG